MNETYQFLSIDQNILWTEPFRNNLPLDNITRGGG